MVARARVHRGLVQLDPTELVIVTVVPFDLFMMLLSALSCAFTGWAVLYLSTKLDPPQGRE